MFFFLMIFTEDFRVHIITVEKTSQKYLNKLFCSSLVRFLDVMLNLKRILILIL